MDLKIYLQKNLQRCALFLATEHFLCYCSSICKALWNYSSIVLNCPALCWDPSHSLITLKYMLWKYQQICRLSSQSWLFLNGGTISFLLVVLLRRWLTSPTWQEKGCGLCLHISTTSLTSPDDPCWNWWQMMQQNHSSALELDPPGTPLSRLVERKNKKMRIHKIISPQTTFVLHTFSLVGARWFCMNNSCKLMNRW